MVDSKYLIFERVDPKDRKTAWVDVKGKRLGVPLGNIAWYSPWRQYCFYPYPGTVFNTGCMNDIQAVIQVLMDERKSQS